MNFIKTFDRCCHDRRRSLDLLVSKSFTKFILSLRELEYISYHITLHFSFTLLFFMVNKLVRITFKHRVMNREVCFAFLLACLASGLAGFRQRCEFKFISGIIIKAHCLNF